MDLIRTALYGLAKGICALVPISLEGILTVLDHFIGIGLGQGGNASVSACIGIIIALILRYWRNVFGSVKGTAVMLYRMAGSGFSYGKDSDQYQRDMVRFLLSLLPSSAALIIGRTLTLTSLDSDIIVEGICFLICGSLTAAAIRTARGETGDGSMTAGHAVLIGAIALLGMYPGISGFGAALSAALLMGYSPLYSLRSAALASSFAGLFSAIAGAGTVSPAALPIDVVSASACAAAAAAGAYGTVWLTELLLKKDKMMIFTYITVILGLMTVILGTVETISGMTVAELFAALKG